MKHLTSPTNKAQPRASGTASPTLDAELARALRSECQSAASLETRRANAANPFAETLRAQCLAPRETP